MNLNKLKRFFIFTIITLVLSFSFGIEVIASSQTVELIFSNPGENASNEMNFSWHGTSKLSTFYYTLENDTSFSKAVSINVNGELDSSTFTTENISSYVFELTISNLNPNTTYLYKIKVENITSSIKSFKTAGNAGNFNFLWMSDPHVYNVGTSSRYNNLKDMYSNVTNTKGIDIPLIVSTGDDVAYGGGYSCWQIFNTYTNVFNNTVFASTPGNHTYYDYGSNALSSNAFFEAMMNNPNNGFEETDSSYWFLYNSILFISLDAIIANQNSTSLQKQKNMFKEVVDANKGKYQYLIVFQHYPYMNALTGAKSGPYGTNYNQWHTLFDEYDVDIALSGDYHCYYRSKHIDNDNYIDDENSLNGTVYIGAPQIGDRYYTISGHINDDYFAKRIDSPNLAKYSGLTYFEVSNDEIKGTLVDANGVIQDTYSIKAKREVSWDSKKDDIENSFIHSYNGNKSFIDYNSLYSEYIKEIKIYNDSNLLCSATPSSSGYSSLLVEGIENNSSKKLKIEINYIDKTKNNLEIIASTFFDYGSIYGFKALLDNDKLKLSWSSDLKNNIISNYKVYCDGVLLETIDSTKQIYLIDKPNITINSTYQLECIASNGSIVKTLKTSYSNFGDSNFDNSITKDDCLYILKKIQTCYEFQTNEIRLLDQNNDNIIDIADATLIYKNLDNITLLSNKTYTVTVIDKDGNVIQVQHIIYGNNAQAPVINDSKFSHWSDSFNYITKDIVIKPIYTD